MTSSNWVWIGTGLTASIIITLIQCKFYERNQKIQHQVQEKVDKELKYLKKLVS